MNSTSEKKVIDIDVRKQLIAYSMPLIAANLLQSFYGLTDVYLSGIFIGSTGISAVNNASQIMVLLTGILIGLSNGGNVMIGQYFGSKQHEKCKSCAGSFLTLFAFIGIISAVALFFTARQIMTFMRAPALEDAIRYLAICAPGAFAISCYNATAATFRGIGNSKRPLMFVSVSVCINIVLDILLMGLFKMGVAGAALATMVSQYVAMFVSLFSLFVSKKKSLDMNKSHFIPLKQYISPIMNIGVPCAVQMTVASVSWLSVTFLLNKYGVYVSAANGISAKIKDVIQTITAAISMAATAMIAQNLGAKLYDKALKVMYCAMQIAFACSFVLIIIVEIAAPYLVSLFDSTQEVVRAGTVNLRIEIPAQLFYALFMIYHTMMTGAGHTKLVFLSSFTNCIIVRTVFAILFDSFWGATGVYLACMIAPSVSVPIGMIYIKSGRWKRTLV